ncbi:3-hydroxyacyl-ACP dehydratase FabZ family protein [Dokdonia sp. Hel_I_53]|uniref:3-hydroxyacyl-ACP dehydratase FabZ family protein n=1 Tax=Dokdonia sp. Hel_I_53 TaxID=1566287 RepID=UPI001199FDB5|nr:hydroxymyristoyl-ACP dehydratase [Dokdonia sp. Hel_I_53]TVZ51693.1 3-hydroxyacyl-[acyl-carrier-protein] dehydratase [Dokdonia sp. Hel_I_53]
MSPKEIIAALPYSKPFLFVDNIVEVSDQAICGDYTFPEDSFFYKGHFKNHPVTPGVILTECMAQIGLVSLGIFKLRDKELNNLQVAFTNAEVQFLKPVLPSEKVTVTAEETYFRFQKLKCKVSLRNENNEICATGNLSGMFSIINEK